MLMELQQKEQESLIMQNKLIFYFIVYSFLGWCLESIYKTIISKKPVNSGFLYGPFCPMYGLGAIIMIEFGNLSDNIIVIFIMSFVIFSVWEYLVAIILEKLFKTKYWDYSNLKFNIQGRVCLKNSIYWGILGVFLIFIIQPTIDKIINLIPTNTLLCIEIILCLAISVDATITILKIMFIDKKIKQVFDIGNTIKEKLLELKNQSIEDNKENVQNIITELKLKQDILKIKLYKRIIRLKKSFPNMKSENITEFMKQKIYLGELKEKIKKHKRN